MENKNISQIALERIREENIKPISRNVFSIKRVLFWVVVAASFIVGAFAFSLTIFALVNNDWDLYSKFGLSFVMRTLPYFWLVSLVIFTILGEHYYRKTLLGHRRGFVLIAGIYLVSTTFFGSIFYLIGVGESVEKSLVDVDPIYRNIIFNRQEIWSHPEEGLLSGKIILIGDSEIEIIDSHGTVWIINKEDSSFKDKVLINIGERIKIMGDKLEGNLFRAEEIRPWLGM